MVFYSVLINYIAEKM